jgi:hypothetical protein
MAASIGRETAPHRAARPIREACGYCAGFLLLLLAGCAAWAAAFAICSRVH